jgi:hypothetical protein
MIVRGYVRHSEFLESPLHRESECKEVFLIFADICSDILCRHLRVAPLSTHREISPCWQTRSWQGLTLISYIL